MVSEYIVNIREQLRTKTQECEELRTDIKDIANLLDLDTGEEYNFGNIEIAIKGLKQECERLKEENKEIRKYQYEQDFLQQQLDQLKAENEELKQSNITLATALNIKQQKLEKIRQVTESCIKGDVAKIRMEQILQIIDEVE